jgi:hypothetical protein
MQPANAIIRDHNGHALSYVYYENGAGTAPWDCSRAMKRAPSPINIAESQNDPARRRQA